VTHASGVRIENDPGGLHDKETMDALRAHNTLFAGPFKVESFFVYAFDGDRLVGGLSGSLVWDWFSIGNRFFKDDDVLTDMIIALKRHVSDTAEGICVHMPDRKRIDRFVKAGFTYAGTVPGTDKSPDYHHAELRDFHTSREPSYRLSTSFEPDPVHQNTVDRDMEDFYRGCGVTFKTGEIRHVALSEHGFLGGVTADVYGDSVHVNRLVVIPSARGNRIGTRLMEALEDEAERMGCVVIELGTTDFQARGFYERLGYEVVMTRQDNPRGFDSHTMAKRIRP
jgi:GNAT superfamily N-acetyltransferase